MLLYPVLMLLRIAHVLGQSILDSFTLTPNTHCTDRSYNRNGKAHREEAESALMCLMYDDCTHFQWNEPNANDPTFLVDRCNFASHASCGTWTRNDDPLTWVTVPPVTPGMQIFTDLNTPGDDYGLMRLMDEDVCYFHCLITDCVGVVFAGGNCFFKQGGWGINLVGSSGTKSTVKSVLSGCVSGHSCYALHTYQNGQTRAAAQQTCQHAGGHLAEFGSQEELDAVIADGRFAVLHASVWVGVHYAAGQWSGQDSVLSVLPWLDGQPASTSEGTPVVAHPRHSTGAFRLATAADTDTEIPLCEYSAITMTTQGQPMTDLNDGDSTTCFSPQTPAKAAGTTLKTLYLYPLSVSQILVKVHGAGLVCADNAQVWQQKDSQNVGDVMHIKACPLSGTYIWQQKQMCLFTCICDDSHLCDAAYLRLGYTNATISVCEFQVL